MLATMATREYVEFSIPQRYTRLPSDTIRIAKILIFFNIHKCGCCEAGYSSKFCLPKPEKMRIFALEFHYQQYTQHPI